MLAAKQSRRGVKRSWNGMRLREHWEIAPHENPNSVAVYYTKAADEVVVYAVVDCRRNPAWIRRRLRA